jgi:cytochrome c oxidase assembly protein subunit 11
MHTTTFFVRNHAGEAVTGQAVPSVTPGQGAKHLRKTECFCFTQQHLEAGEEMHMPLTFYVDQELPEEIQVLSLSYTLFKVPDLRVAQARSAK